jgi:hypothetical protein
MNATPKLVQPGVESPAKGSQGAKSGYPPSDFSGYRSRRKLREPKPPDMRGRWKRKPKAAAETGQGGAAEAEIVEPRGDSVQSEPHAEQQNDVESVARTDSYHDSPFQSRDLRPIWNRWMD